MFGWGGAARREAEQRAREHERLRLLLVADPPPSRPARLPIVLAAARRAFWRGRRVLAPFAVAGALAVGGGVVAARDLPVPVVALAGAAAGTVWWRTRAHRLDRAVERRYAATVLTLAWAWLLWAAFAAPAWAVLVAGGGVVAAPWWRHHWPRPRVEAPDVDPVGDPVITLWDTHVGDPAGPLPGARLVEPVPFEHGTEYRVLLVPGRQTATSALSQLERVASGVRTPMQRLVLEAHPDHADDDPTICRLRRIRTSPVAGTVYFDRPRHRDGVVDLGPIADGVGEALWRVYTRDSMWGGFALGSTGVGKSRLIESVALTVRDMSAHGRPTLLAYVDGQDGASSSTLWRHASLRADTRTVADLLDGLEAVISIRQRFNVLHRLTGFTPGRAPDGTTEGLTGILVIVDEAHVPFGMHARRWSRIAREGRKVGVAVFAASQYNDLSVFGGEDPLRSSLLAGNGLAMHTASSGARNLIPGLRINPADLPAIPGFGYKIAAQGSGERTAPFRARYLPSIRDKQDDPSIPVPTVEEWFDRTSDAPLDGMSARAMGELYLRREERARAEEEAALAAIEGRPTGRETVVVSKQPAPDRTRDVIERLLIVGPRKRAEIAAHVKDAIGTGPSAVKAALEQMLRDRVVERTGEHGVYQLTAHPAREVSV